jgi:hypothetical protein
MRPELQCKPLRPREKSRRCKNRGEQWKKQGKEQCAGRWKQADIRPRADAGSLICDRPGQPGRPPPEDDPGVIRDFAFSRASWPRVPPRSGLFCQTAPSLAAAATATATRGSRARPKSGSFCQTVPSLAAAATAAHGSRALPKTGLFCQNRPSLAAAMTAAHGSRRRRLGAGPPCNASNALMAEFRRDSARRS